MTPKLSFYGGGKYFYKKKQISISLSGRYIFTGFKSHISGIKIRLSGIPFKPKNAFFKGCAMTPA
jgi:hypothetical protein